jgi:hypothetical protein
MTTTNANFGTDALVPRGTRTNPRAQSGAQNEEESEEKSKKYDNNKSAKGERGGCQSKLSM